MKIAIPAAPVAALVLTAALGAQNIQTIAGNGSPGFSGDGGPARAASISPDLDLTANVAVARNGDLYFTDTNNNRIRKVDAKTREISTIAGTGAAGGDGDGGPATEAQLCGPTDLVFDGEGRLVVADAGNNRIRRIDLSTGGIETIAGTGAMGRSGDGGPAAAATFSYPASLDFDAAGNLWIADTWNATIRRVDAQTGVVTRVAGAGCFTYAQDGQPALDACFTLPTHIRLAPDGAAVIALNGDSRVVRIDPGSGTIGTIAGTGVAAFSGDGGPSENARLAQPNGVAFDRSGNLYIADSQSQRIRRVDAGTGVITTVAGNGRSPSNGIGSFSGDGGPALLAGLSLPNGVTVDRRGHLLIVDALNARLRKVTQMAPVVVHVPEVSRGGGAVSDLVLTNRAAQPTRVRLRYTPQGAAPLTRTVVVPALSVFRADDALALLGAPDGAGALRIVFADVTDPPLVSARSRAAAAVPGGIHGPLVSGIPQGDSEDDVQWLFGLREGNGFSTDLVLLNAGDGRGPLRLEVARFSSDGAPAGDPSVVTLPDGAPARVARVLGALDSGSVRLRRLSGSGAFLAQAVVSANGDDRIVLAARGDGLIPVVLEAPGTRTDLELFNAADEASTVRLAYTPAPGLAGGGIATLELAPRESRSVSGLSAFLVAGGVPIGDRLLGTLRVTGASAEAFVVVDREGGSYGTGVPAVPSSGFASRAAFVDGLRQDDATRSHVAVANASDGGDPVAFTLAFFDGASGAEVRRETLVLRGGEWGQVPSALLGTGASRGWARVTAPAGSHFVAYGVLADGAEPGTGTSAPGWLPMTLAD